VRGSALCTAIVREGGQSRPGDRHLWCDVCLCARIDAHSVVVTTRPSRLRPCANSPLRTLLSRPYKTKEPGKIPGSFYDFSVLFSFRLRSTTCISSRQLSEPQLRTNPALSPTCAVRISMRLYRCPDIPSIARTARPVLRNRGPETLSGHLAPYLNHLLFLSPLESGQSQIQYRCVGFRKRLLALGSGL